MRIFIIDNNDSFTYNLKHYVEQFASEVIVCRGSEIDLELIGEYDKIILSPGPGLPNEHPVLNQVLFKDIPKNFKIGHYHSWVVSKIDFPNELTITSESEDGIITSLNHKKYDITAVQFHPESILTEHGLQLIKNWVLA